LPWRPLRQAGGRIGIILLAAWQAAAGARAAGTMEENKAAWAVFLSAEKSIVAQCVYRPRAEDVFWGAMAGLSKDLGPAYAKYFPQNQGSGSVDDARDALSFVLLRLDAEANLPMKLTVAKSLRAYCRGLDRYSDYDDYDTWAKVQAALKFNYVGIGVNLTDRAGEGFMLSPFPDSPAETGGIITGDFLEEIDGVSTRGMSKEEIISASLGQPGTKVTVKVRHPEGGEESIGIVREKLDTSPLIIEQSPAGARVACRRITDQAVDDLRVFLGSQRPGQPLTLDLRGCEGGTVTAGVNLASLFLRPGTTIGKLETAAGQEKLVSTNKTPFRPSRLIILQDRFTASAAELVIVALVANGKGWTETRGERTFGKGVTVMEVAIADQQGAPAGILLITDSRMYGSDNEVWDGDGLPPTAAAP
jgi:carboxyl-terminal processing protease